MQSARPWLAVAVGAVLAVTSSACAITGKSSLFVEPGAQRAPGPMRRVAVVPNRLPTMLTDAETWRQFNFKLLQDELSSRGYEVVDYDTSVQAFERSGLPVEDTKSSRDKYADLAAQLGVDGIVVPYYGTTGKTKGGILYESWFDSIATLQLYSASKNDFVARVDASGTSWLQGGGVQLAGIITSIVGSGVGLGAAGGCTGCGLAGIILSLVGTALTLGDAIGAQLVPPFSWEPEEHYRHAFRKAIAEGGPSLMSSFPATGPARIQAPRPPAPVQGPPPPSPSTSSECRSNDDCKAGRVCRQGACAWPQ